MEDILARLLVADNVIIQQATKELKTALKAPTAIGNLCCILGTSNNARIRHYAAVILRQRLGKRKWCSLEPNLKSSFIQQMLIILNTEPDQTVLKAVVQLIGKIAKHELTSNYAKELVEFVGELCSVNDDQEASRKMRGFFILSMLSDECPDLFSSVLPSVTALIMNTLRSISDAKSPLMWNSYQTLKNLSLHFNEDSTIKSCCSVMLPRILKAVKELITDDEGKACELLDLIDNFMDHFVLTSVNHITPIVHACVDLVNSNAKLEQIQMNVISILDTTVTKKKKAVIRHNLLQPIIYTLVQIIQLPSEEDLDYNNANEMNCPVIYAAQVLDGLALNVAPTKFMPQLLDSLQTLAASENPNQRKAVCIIMAVTSEGCAEYILNKCFNIYLECVCKGLEDPIVCVRNASLYALGQFAEHLQPEVGKHSERLMPFLFRFLEQITFPLEDKAEKLQLDRVFYATETFIENSDKEAVLPYLDSLIGALLSLVTMTESSTHLKRLALSSIGACANTAEDDISPFISRIIECVSVYLVSEVREDTLCLQVDAIDTMATLARVVSPENFQVVANDCVRYGYLMMEGKCEPELEGCIYGLFGAVSAVLKEQMSEIMEPVVSRMLKTIESKEGIVVHYDEENDSFPECSDISDSPDELDLEVTSDEEDDQIAGFSVENVFFDKKVSACYAVKELALNTRAAFDPYLIPTFAPMMKLLEYPHETIKKASLEVLTQLCVNLSASNSIDRSTFDNYISVLIQKCAEIVHTNEDREVVAQCLESYTYLLKSSKNFTLQQEGHREAIFNCILDVFHKRTLCQLEEEDLNADADADEDAEQEELLIEYAGDILPYFGRAMPPDVFMTYFLIMFPLLKTKLKPECTVAQHSFAVGILAECMEPLGPHIHDVANEIFPAFMVYSKHNNDDVRNNAVYGLGEMLFHGKEQFFAMYPDVLQHLSQMLGQEVVPKVIDNICGAVARMVVVNTNLIPLAQVFPVIINCLPLKKDYKENSMLLKCFLHLYEAGHSVVAQHLDNIIYTIVHIVHNKQGEEDALLLAEHLFTSIKNDFPDHLSLLTIPNDMIETWSKLMKR